MISLPVSNCHFRSPGAAFPAAGKDSNINESRKAVKTDNFTTDLKCAMAQAGMIVDMITLSGFG